MAYCEYYTCCRTRPCGLHDSPSASSRADIRLQKSHDEFLRRQDDNYEPSLELSNRGKQLVQIRHPIPSTISEFEMIRNKQRSEDRNDRVGHAARDSTSAQVDWLPFATKGLEYRSRFLEKWILRNPWVDSDQYYVLDYDHLLTQPRKTLCDVIQFLCPKEFVDDSRIDAALARSPVKPKRDPEDFEFASTLSDLEPLYADTWQACREKLGWNC